MSNLTKKNTMSRARFQTADVIGSGPNGLAAAIELARAGLEVRVSEAEKIIGGGTRSFELTLPGFTHDICSAVHPLALSSPFFRSLPFAAHGLEWIQPTAQLAHPFDDGTAILLERSVEKTCDSLNRRDAAAYRELMQPLVDDWDYLAPELLRPVPLVPRHPFKLARFGLSAIRSAESLAKSRFSSERTRGFFAGVAAHSMLALDSAATASFALVLLTAGHAVGWQIPRGGSQKIADALAAYFCSLGGEIFTDSRVESVDDLLTTKNAVVCDLTAHNFLKVAGNQLPKHYRRKLENYRKGGGAFKIDWALNAPIPWKAAECALAATVHLGGTFAEIAASETASAKGEHAERPYVLLVQPSLFDASRAPAGKHTAWAYCHVPNGSTFDMTARIEDQIERFAPGFRDCVIAKKVSPPAELERRNANLVGGNISGGSNEFSQLFLRPTIDLYETPTRGLFICSSSTPPGGGVHGMCGFYAAQSVLRQ